MAAKVAISIAVSFVFVLLEIVPGASQEIPDDKVYTELKKTLIHGSSGILTCRFTGAPYAVYWKKGHDPWNSPTLMTWTPEAKTGPRYVDGSCDMTENYSLVIKTVNYTDTGRYICFVSNQHGVLIDNYTDVTVTDVALKTKSAVTLQKGQTGTVPCQVHIRPKKVSWVRSTNETLVFIDLSHDVIKRSGPGYKERLFNITKEYSLVIYNVTIQHEDNYFCVVIDYDTRNVYQDATVLTIFAYPREPFPVIEECPVNSSSSCSLRISSDTTLTCQVDEYYPEIDLYFVRGSERVQSLETKELNNSDGTMNKRIRITADGGTDNSFDCVATGFAGQTITRSMTIHLIQDSRQSGVVVAVVVPVILVSAIIAIAVYVLKRRKRHMKRKYAKVSMVYKGKQRDLISYIELWTLVKYAREQNLSDKLGHVLYKLTIDKCTSNALHTDEDYYQEFCQWKAGYTGACQREDFFDACMNAGLESAIDELQKYYDSTRAVTADDLEHTLWHITGSDKIIGLLEDLGALHEHLEVLKHKGQREVVEGAMNILKQWRDLNSSGNQEVMLSLALETIKYTPSDKDFFRIPECHKQGLDKNEIKAFILPQITSRHCTELIDATIEFSKKYNLATGLFKSKNKYAWIDNNIEENITGLFDSHQMIEDWWAEQNCSNYEKRCRLWQAANVFKGRTDDLDVPEESDEKWPSTKKLEHIAKLVPQTRMKQLLDVLHISYMSDDFVDEERRFKTMCRWRDGSTKLKKEKKIRVLSTALKSIGFDGLWSPYKCKFIYKAELVDMALDLIMEDFRPFADILGINRTKLTSYRQEFRASHLDHGTIRLVLRLCNMIESVSVGDVRYKVCSILDKAGYPNVIKRFIFASEPSYGELFAIANAVTKDDIPKDGTDTPESGGESNQANETVQTGHGSGEKAEECPTGHQKTTRSDATLTSVNVEGMKNNDDDREDIDTEYSGVPPKQIGDIKNKSKHAKSNTDGNRQRVSDLQKVLELTDEDIPDSNTASIFTLLKIWKERVCPGLLDHRVVLAEGLQKINKPHLVAAVINGKHNSRETSLDFITDMLNEMDEGRRISLRRLLEIKEEKLGKVMTSDEMSRRICDWVANWTKAMEGTIKNHLKDTVRINETSKRHQGFNDKLVDNGFLDLAREIMNIEQGQETDESIIKTIIDNVVKLKTRSISKVTGTLINIILT